MDNIYINTLQLLKKNIQSTGQPISYRMFNSKNDVSINIDDYILRWYKYGDMSDETKIKALMLLERLLTKNSILLTLRNIHRFIALSYLVSIKINEDIHMDNVYYSYVSGIPKSELFYLECIYLCIIDFNLYINDNDYFNFQLKLI